MANAFLAQNLIERIYPTENDVADVPTDGQFGLEGNVVAANNGIGWDGVLPELDGSNFPTNVSGLKLSSNTGLKFKISRGRAIIDGYYMRLKSGADIAVDKDGNDLVVDASATTVVFLTLAETGGIVDAINSIEIKTLLYTGPTSVVVPQRSIPLGILVSDATTITNFYDMRSSGLQVPLIAEPYWEWAATAGQTGTGIKTLNKYGYAVLPVMGGFSQLLISMYLTRNLVVNFVNPNIVLDWKIKSSLGILTGTISKNVGTGILSNLKLDWAINWQNGNDMRWDATGAISVQLDWKLPFGDAGLITYKTEILGATIKNWQN